MDELCLYLVGDEAPLRSFCFLKCQKEGLYSLSICISLGSERAMNDAAGLRSSARCS